MSRWLLVLVPAALFAAEPFDGTWKLDLSKVELPTKVYKIELNKGMYSCSNCNPAVNIKADGTDQKVPDANTFDTESVKVVDAKTIEFTNKKAGKVVHVEKWTVSADGTHVDTTFTDYPANSPQPVTGEVTMVRADKGSAGAHAISGGWRNDKVGTVSDNGITMTYKSTAGGLSYSDPTGVSYAAKFDGKDYPTKGDAGSDMVSLKRGDANSFEETYKKNGKIIVVNHFSVAADGKTGSVASEDKKQGTTLKFGIVKK